MWIDNIKEDPKDMKMDIRVAAEMIGTRRSGEQSYHLIISVTPQTRNKKKISLMRIFLISHILFLMLSLASDSSILL